MHSSMGPDVVDAAGKGPRQQSSEDSSTMHNGERAQQFSKTKLCKFQLLGICAKGRACPFAHGQTDLRPLPDLRCTKLCAALLQTGVCNNQDCAFAHSRDELRTTSTFRKTKPCRFMQTGHCTLGWKCNFAHSPDEVRPLESSNRHEGSVTGQAHHQRMPYKVPLETVIEPPTASDSGLPWGNFFANVPPTDASGMRVTMPGLSPWPAALPGLSPVDEPAYIPLRGSLVVDQSEDAWQVKCAPFGGQRMSPIRSVRTSESTLCTLGDEPIWNAQA
mmetsp:Transcript_57612/g.148197  ORF Transcript_57612/g.148197 Transcript_57612/m.148197 type:complete len:275 (-) Transcript_57612:656-1480(-)